MLYTFKWWARTSISKAYFVYLWRSSRQSISCLSSQVHLPIVRKQRQLNLQCLWAGVGMQCSPHQEKGWLEWVMWVMLGSKTPLNRTCSGKNFNWKLKFYWKFRCVSRGGVQSWIICGVQSKTNMWSSLFKSMKRVSLMILKLKDFSFLLKGSNCHGIF